MFWLAKSRLAKWALTAKKSPAFAGGDERGELLAH
jgi:hypothetical protein